MVRRLSALPPAAARTTLRGQVRSLHPCEDPEEPREVGGCDDRGGGGGGRGGGREAASGARHRRGTKHSRCGRFKCPKEDPSDPVMRQPRWAQIDDSGSSGTRTSQRSAL